MKKIIPFILVFLVSCSVSYKFNGSIIDYSKIKTIYIADFPIKAPLVYPPLGVVFNEELKDVFTRQTRLTLVNRGGDLQLEGEITGYDLSPQAVGEDAYASQTRLTVTVRVRYTNAQNPAQDVEQTFRAYKDFSSSVMLNQVQDELVREIVEELTTLIFNATVGSW